MTRPAETPPVGDPQEDPAEDAFVIRVREVIVRALLLEPSARPRLTLHAPLWADGGLGLDSVDAIELAVELEREFGVRMPEGEEHQEIYTSIATISSYLRAALGDASPPSGPGAG